jgi:hypothetical protein
VTTPAPALAATTANAAGANAAVANVTAAPPRVATNIQQQLQALNNALAALGLSNDIIHKIDGIAGLINDFNPAAFNSLVSQLEAVAQQQKSPQVATAAAKANAASPTAATPNTATANAANANVANANAGGFQLQELLIRFSGAGTQGAARGVNNGSGATGAVVTASPNGPFPAVAPNLQVELRLTDNNGHTVRVLAPAEGVNANPPITENQAPAQTRAAAA